ncbi:MAG: hypothetical protein ACP5I3_09965 [Thermoproteus sp.]
MSSSEEKSLVKLILYTPGWGYVEVYGDRTSISSILNAVCVWIERYENSLRAVCNLYTLGEALIRCYAGDALVRVLPKEEFK